VLLALAPDLAQMLTRSGPGGLVEIHMTASKFF
jgi:hypothetical protein